MKHDVSRQIFKKYSNIKFHENTPSWSRIVPCGRMDGGTDMTRLTIGCRNSENVPENCRKKLLELEAMKTIKQMEVING